MQEQDCEQGSPPRVRGRAAGPRHRPSGVGITPACAGKSPWTASTSTAAWDHPRVCGEERLSGVPLSNTRGSPPRVRGRGYMGLWCQPEQRITPACAGKSRANHAIEFIEKDHPRVCGEEQYPCGVIRPFAGSPPRVRGRVCAVLNPPRAARITPACAGKSGPSAQGARAGQDHPRVCGEEEDKSIQKVHRAGSPPRVRGREISKEGVESFERITPACAGKRCWPSGAWPPCPDHPRVCGEERLQYFFLFRLKGSPPRVRGRGRARDRLCRRARITPACAGKSSSLRSSALKSGDHPRVCGEELLFILFSPVSVGSPPRVRGRAVVDVYVHAADGITPACAGKSRLSLPCGRCGWDHPRVCGEEHLPSRSRLGAGGSPPRVRGRVQLVSV